MSVKRINIILLLILLVTPFNYVYADEREFDEEFFDQVYAIHSLREAGELNAFLLSLFKVDLIILRDRYVRKGGENYKMIQAANLYIEADGIGKEYLELWLLAADNLLSSSADSLTKEQANAIILPILKAGVITIEAESAAQKARQAQELSKRIIIDIQTYLKELGYDVGIIDGYKGPRTIAAINQFKQGNGLSTDEDYTDSQLLTELMSIAEEKRLKQKKAQRHTINEYGQKIQEKVQRNWTRPQGSSSALSCTVEVRLIPSGEVIDVQIVRSSGNAAFDLSVETALFKASPLPMPPSSEVAEQFRSLRFDFKPG